MKRAFAALALLSIAYGCFASDFRNASWLMTEDQVAASEDTRAAGEVTLPGERQIVYHALVHGFAATITYTLVGDKLLSATCRFTKDPGRAAFNAMKQELLGTRGAPAFEKENLLGWRLDRTEIALTYLADGTTYAAYWEKAYFARINDVAETGSTLKN